MTGTTEQKMNRKRAYSRRVIRDAFLEIAQTTLISDITVTDICRVADINRTTFYANYDNISDLLQSIVSELHQKLTHVMVQYEHMNTEEFYIAMLRIIQENASLCLVMTQLSDRELEVMHIDFNRPIQSRNLRIRNSSPEGLQIASDYIICGTSYVIVKWLKQGMEPPAEVLAKQLREINGFLMKVNDQ